MNHQSPLDWLLVAALLVPKTNRRLSVFLHKAYYDFPIAGRLFKHWQAVRVEPKDENKRMQSMLDAVVKLKEGNDLIIFPEGDVGVWQNSLLRAYTGVIRIALLSRKKIIPVGIENCYNAWKFPRNFWKAPHHLFRFNFSRNIKIRFGQPIDLSQHYGINLEVRTEANKKLLRKLVTELMVEIGCLANMEYQHDRELLCKKR